MSNIVSQATHGHPGAHVFAAGATLANMFSGNQLQEIVGIIAGLMAIIVYGLTIYDRWKKKN